MYTCIHMTIKFLIYSYVFLSNARSFLRFAMREKNFVSRTVEHYKNFRSARKVKMAAMLVIAGYEMRNCEIDNNFVTYRSTAARRTKISIRSSVPVQISFSHFRLLTIFAIATREKSFVARVPLETCRNSRLV